MEVDERAQKIVLVNRGDLDRDDIPDFADGYGHFGTDSGGGVPGLRFVPIRVRFGSPESSTDYTIEFHYETSPPGDVVRQQFDVPSIESNYYGFERPYAPHGAMRIWKRDGDEPRSLADYIEPGTRIPVSAIGCNTTFFVEAVSGYELRNLIIAQVYDSENRLIAGDAVSVQLFDPLTGLEPPNRQILGYHVLRGAAQGTTGNDIIWASPSAAVVQTYEGNDIIIAAGVDQAIHAGQGKDVVYLPHQGTHQLVFDPIQSSTRDLTRDEDPCAINAANDHAIYLNNAQQNRPLARTLIVRAYKQLYGESDPWLRIYESTLVKGKIFAVAAATTTERAKITCVDCDAGRRVEISVQFDQLRPFIAATLLREAILEVAKSDSDCSLATEMRQYLMDAAATALVRDVNLQLGREEGDEDADAIALFEQMRQEAFDDATATAAALSTAYITGVTVVSEATDVVVSVSEVAQGNYSAGWGLVPMVPFTAVSTGSKLVLKTVNGTQIVQKVGQVTLHFPDLGWIFRRGMPVQHGPLVNGRRTIIIGTPQITGPNSPGAAHALKCQEIGDAAAAIGDAEYVVYNRSLRTATGKEKSELTVVVDDVTINVADWRPDVIVVRRGPNGRPIIKIWEVERQGGVPDAEIRTKLETMMRAIRCDCDIESDFVRYGNATP